LKGEKRKMKTSRKIDNSLAENERERRKRKRRQRNL
jgi:hypothetical protein